MTTLYVAGPMTGLPEFNYPAFKRAAEELRAAGYAVLNPTDIDVEGVEPGAQPWEWYMRRTLTMMLGADHLALLPGWEGSRGARVEVDLSGELGMDALMVDTWLERAAQEVAR